MRYNPRLIRMRTPGRVLSGIVLAGMLCAGAAVLWPSGAVEVTIDAARGEVKKIPIAIFNFREALQGEATNLTDVLLADLRRS
jgi:hypothetical protein